MLDPNLKLESDYNELETVLNKLLTDSEEGVSTSLKNEVQQAILFYAALREDLDSFSEEYSELWTKYKGISPSNPNEVGTAEVFGSIHRYTKIRDAGGDAKLICKVALLDGAEDWMCKRILHDLFPFTIEELQSIVEESKKTISILGEDI